MKTLDRHLAVTFAAHFASALAILLAVFSIVNFIQEIESTGTGDYGIAEAAWFVFLTLPNEAYKLIPAAALLGSVTGLGSLANANEIVAMSAGGISPSRISWFVVQVALILLGGAALLGEFGAAPLVKRAQSQRSAALSGGKAVSAAEGFWARDGARFVNAGSLLPDGTLHDLYVFEFDPERRMKRFTYAEKASYADRKWTLENLVDSHFTEDDVRTERHAVGVWDSLLKPRQLSFLFLPPEDLSLADLQRSISSRRERNESADRQLLAFWRRLTWPVVSAIMLYVGLPVVLASFRRTTAGKRIAIAALAGIGFQMFNEVFADFSFAQGLDPRLCAVLPATAALTAAVFVMRQVR
jgi:lipopolysaccharide export system permease protein